MKNEQARGETAPVEDDSDRLLQSCLDRLAAGDPTAKNDLITVAYSRLTRRALQMLRGFPAVRRSSDTCDVVQESCRRLAESLDKVHPEPPADS